MRSMVQLAGVADPHGDFFWGDPHEDFLWGGGFDGWVRRGGIFLGLIVE